MSFIGASALDRDVFFVAVQQCGHPKRSSDHVTGWSRGKSTATSYLDTTIECLANAWIDPNAL